MSGAEGTSRDDGHPGAGNDPVLVRRARIAAAVTIGKRVGYGLLGAAVVAFFVGYAVGFDQALVTVIVAALVVSSVILAPAIVFGYGVRAAEREDREAGQPPA